MTRGYVPGAWNADCAECSRRLKNYELRRDWRGLYKCSRCWEPRHPQDFVRAVPERPAPPWVQDLGDPVDVGVCTPNGQSAVAGYGTAGCAIADYVHPYFDTNISE